MSAWPVFLALASALACSRCSFIRRRKPSSSTDRPASEAISSVRSIGKPKVSCSLNASEPENTVEPDLRVSSATFSNSVEPVRSVWRKEASSATATASMRVWSANSSGYCGPIALTVVSTSSLMVWPDAPSRRMLRIARRIRRRST